MGFLKFQKKSKKQFIPAVLPELILDKDTDSNVSSTNSSPVSDSFVTENHISIFSQNSLLDDILNELPKQGKQLYSSSVSSNIFKDYYRSSESSKSDSSNDGINSGSDSVYGTQNALLKRNISQEGTYKSNFKNNTNIMKLPSSTISDKNQLPLSINNGPQVDKSFQSTISSNMSTQFLLKSKKSQKMINDTNEEMLSGESNAKNTHRDLAQLNNISISRMKERHRQECRKSGQYTHTPSKVKLQTHNHVYKTGGQNQMVYQSSPIIAPPNVSAKYQTYTPSISSRTKPHPLPLQTTVVPSDLNRFKYGSLRSTVHKYQNTPEHMSKQHNILIKYGERVNNQCTECHQHQYFAKNIHRPSSKHQIIYIKNSCSSKIRINDNVISKDPACITQKRNQNILTLGKIFEKHMSNNPKLKAEIDRVPQVYKKNYHSVPHSLHLLDNGKPKLAHKLMAETLITRKGRELSVKGATCSFDNSSNEYHGKNNCSKHFEAYPNCRIFFCDNSRIQACQHSNSHKCCFKGGYIESAVELSETFSDRTYNDKITHPVNIRMDESRYNQDYKQNYRN